MSDAWAWLAFFLIGIAATADQAFDAAKRIVDLLARGREAIASNGDRSSTVLRVHELLQKNPVASSATLVRQTGLTAPTINAALADLAELKIVEEITGRRRGRVFAYGAYLAILNEGTAPLASSS